MYVHKGFFQVYYKNIKQSEKKKTKRKKKIKLYLPVFIVSLRISLCYRIQVEKKIDAPFTLFFAFLSL